MQCKSVISCVVLQMAVSGIALAAEPPVVADPGIKQDRTDVIKGVAPVRASKLIGMEVYNRQDKHLGEVADIVLDSGGTKIGYAVLSYGGILGMGDKLFAVPYRMLEYSSTQQSRLYINVDEQTLRGAPGFDKKNWPDKANADYYTQLDKYYAGRDVVRHEVAKIDPGMTREMPSPVKPAPMTEGLTWTRRLTSLIGANVESPGGDQLGEINDVVVDWDSGHVQYDVLSFGGVLGIGDKLFAVPSDRFTSKPNEKELVLNVDKETLKRATGFDQKNWPNFADRSWREQNDRAFPAIRSREATIEMPDQ